MPHPLVIAHRGASGYRPEHTVAAYDLAVRMGADYIEPDLVMSRDGVLVDRHEPDISHATDVADHPELADRRTTKEVDGQQVTGWFAEDLTLAELKTLRCRERITGLRQQSSMYDGRDEVLTFEETLQLRERLSAEHGREVGIIPEIKSSTYLHGLGLDPESELVRLVDAYGLNAPEAPMWVQSFEVGNLRALREEHGYRARLFLLMTVQGGPFDLVAEGTSYSDLLRPEALRELARWIDGIGPDKSQVIPREADGSLGQPSSVVRDAQAAGLLVMPWTFRAENSFLPTDLRVGDHLSHFGRAIDEVRIFLEAGVDGIFCDQPDIGLVARADFLGTS